jgi:hypothetical protein
MSKRILLASCAIALLFLAGGIALGRRAPRGNTAPSVALGEHLVTILACDDCHTPFMLGPAGPEPDMSRRLSGHPASLPLGIPPVPDTGPWQWVGTGTNTAFAGPWGVTFAANLTPDETTGLAIWTEEMFVRSLRDGRHMGQSRQIQPPMPWRAYGSMTDQELKSVYAYLRTVPPVENLVPDYRAPGETDDGSDPVQP